MEEPLQNDIWEMTCPGCQNGCRLTVHGMTSKSLRRVVGSHCGAGFTYARRALAAKETAEAAKEGEKLC